VCTCHHSMLLLAHMHKPWPTVLVWKQGVGSTPWRQAHCLAASTSSCWQHHMPPWCCVFHAGCGSATSTPMHVVERPEGSLRALQDLPHLPSCRQWHLCCTGRLDLLGSCSSTTPWAVFQVCRTGMPGLCFLVYVPRGRWDAASCQVAAASDDLTLDVCVCVVGVLRVYYPQWHEPWGDIAGLSLLWHSISCGGCCEAPC
jgi:hypothetical protein